MHQDRVDIDERGVEGLMTRPSASLLVEIIRTVCRGEDNEISGSDLALLFGFSDTRDVRYLVEEARKNRKPICFKGGKDGGYFWPRSPKEAEHTINYFHKMSEDFRTLELMILAAVTKKPRKKQPPAEQMELFGGNDG